jgi:hypothetical protein
MESEYITKSIGVCHITYFIILSSFVSSIHICVTCNHAKDGVTTAFLKDLNKISEELLANPEEKGKESKTVYILNCLHVEYAI